MWIRPTLPSSVLIGFFAATVLSPVSLARAADKNAPPLTPSPVATDWDRQAAARYLDSREVWWQSWDRAQKDHGTYCISCHTQAPYGRARPSVPQTWGARARGG